MKQQERVVYICCISSWYQKLGALSYFHSKKIQAEAIHFVVQDFLHSSLQIVPAEFKAFSQKISTHSSYEDLSAEITQENPSLLRIISATDTPIKAIITARAHSKKIELIQIEDGIGSYANRKQKIQAYLRENKGNKIFLWSKWWLRNLFGKIIIYRIKKTIWLQYDERCIKNTNVIDGYKLALKNLHDLSEPPNLEKIKGIFLTAPLVELNVLSNETYINIIRREIQNAPAEWLIKPHPAEDTHKYHGLGAQVLISKTPIEAILSQTHWRGNIHSFSSTSIYNLRNFFDLPVFRISSHDYFYDKLGSNQKLIIDTTSE